MIVEIAKGWGTSPSDWWDEDDATLATAIELLAAEADAMEG